MVIPRRSARFVIRRASTAKAEVMRSTHVTTFMNGPTLSCVSGRRGKSGRSEEETRSVVMASQAQKDNLKVDSTQRPSESKDVRQHAAKIEKVKR